MAPVGYLLLGGLAAAFLAFCGKLMPRLFRDFFATGVFGRCLVATGTILRIITQQRLHPIAMILVGFGLGTQLARLVYRQPDRAIQIGRRFSLAIGAIVLLLLEGVEGGRLDSRTNSRQNPPA
jgi:putative copper export protein